eukprot:6058155-Pyramimonas_sp.AAC.1
MEDVDDFLQTELDADAAPVPPGGTESAPPPPPGGAAGSAPPPPVPTAAPAPGGTGSEAVSGGPGTTVPPDGAASGVRYRAGYPGSDRSSMQGRVPWLRQEFDAGQGTL